MTGVELELGASGVCDGVLDDPGHAEQPLWVIASHFPLLDCGGPLAGSSLSFPPGLANRESLAAAIHAAGPAVVVLSGHLHARASVTDGTVLQLLMPAVVEAPMEATVVDIDAEAGVVTRTAVALSALTDPPCRPILGSSLERWRLEDGRWQLMAFAHDAAA
jgi:hypothetical protein